MSNDPVQVNDALLRSWPLPDLDDGGDKESRGAVYVIAGCREMPGAAILAAEATLRAGAGKLEVAVPACVSALVAAAMPEAKVVGFEETAAGGPVPTFVRSIHERVDRVDALLIGPGMADDEAVLQLVRAACKGARERRCLLDAAALGVLRDARYRFDHTAVITPHLGEMATLMGVEKAEVEANPAELALRLAARANVVVTLKGKTTHVASPDGRIFRYAEGHPGLGMSGSGDVLAGLITGLLARGAELEQAAVWGVALHGHAAQALGARVGRLGYLARELAAEVPRSMESLRTPA